jgi:WD40 repeat protein
MTIVNAATGQVVRRLGSVVLDTQGPFMFSADDSKLILLETPSAKVIVGPGGRGAGLTGADRLVVLTLATGRAVTLPGAEPCGPGTPVKWAFSGDGRRVAQAGFCGIVDVWDTQTGHLLRQLDQGAETSAVALDDTGARVLVSSWDSRATIWSVRTGRSLVRFIGHTRGIADAALSRDGTRILTASLDRTVRVWDAHTGQVLRVLSFAAPPTPVIFSTDGSQVVLDESSPISGVPDILRVYDTCPACQDGAALLRLAQPHTTRQLTQLERTVIAAN